MKKLLGDKRTLIAICVAVVVVLVIVIVLCLTQCSSNSQSQNVSTQTTTTTTQTNKTTKKDTTTSKTEDSSTDDDEETSTSSEDASSASGESTSNSAQSSSSNGGGSYSNSGSSSPQTSSSEQSHEHTWVWVSNVVTVTDQEAYDEPVYRWATWCNKCNCEVDNEHTGDMAEQGQYGHSLGDMQVLDHYEHHDAVTHTEDQGYYKCSSCGAIQQEESAS